MGGTLHRLSAGISEKEGRGPQVWGGGILWAGPFHRLMNGGIRPAISGKGRGFQESGTAHFWPFVVGLRTATAPMGMSFSYCLTTRYKDAPGAPTSIHPPSWIELVPTCSCHLLKDASFF